MNLILASQSPRRKELLGLFGIPFTVRVASVDEAMDASANPFDEVARVSRLKALAVPRTAGDVVVAADTIVVCNNKVLGKPKDEADACAMLRLLSGKHTYCETHNALHDALDELEIMRLLGYSSDQYIPLT